jgi:hypothetical protein
MGKVYHWMTHVLPSSRCHQQRTGQGELLPTRSAVLPARERATGAGSGAAGEAAVVPARTTVLQAWFPGRCHCESRRVVFYKKNIVRNVHPRWTFLILSILPLPTTRCRRWPSAQGCADGNCSCVDGMTGVDTLTVLVVSAVKDRHPMGATDGSCGWTRSFQPVFCFSGLSPNRTAPVRLDV